jgi:hypothetical protein
MSIGIDDWSHIPILSSESVVILYVCCTLGGFLSPLTGEALPLQFSPVEGEKVKTLAWT